ncbi:MAG TPA: hypothetical protein GX017_03985 [Clostridiales bacterium]|jgi:hypothetical protein|nr:hypothetical protein [Clostridiales bacterium]
MIQTILYIMVCLAAAAVTTLLVNRNKSYHHFMIRQCNMGDEEYDRIYSTPTLAGSQCEQ